MKTTIKLLIILFGLFASAQSKHFIYISFEVDVNKATGLIDNPDTIIVLIFMLFMVGLIPILQTADFITTEQV